MAKQYKGSLSLDWYNKQKAILLRSEEDTKTNTDIPAPKINWVNKDEALFYEINEEEGRGIAPFWVDRNDIRVKEARPLIFQKAYKAIPKDIDGSLPGMASEYKIQELNQDDPSIENILIKGDNLLALNTLKKIFDNKPEDEKVKCIYIDPPYNTGSAFELYDDNLAHSEWLTMMRDRLEVLYSLLRIDGSIIVHLDDQEAFYCKILLDEIFGRDNFINSISVKSSTPSGVKTAHREKTIIKQKDIVLVYRKSDNLTIKPIYVKRNNWDSHYSLFIEQDTSNSDNYILKNLIDVLLDKNIIPEKISVKDLDISNPKFKNFYISNANKICRLQTHKNSEAEIFSKSDFNKDKVVRFKDKTGDNFSLYYNGGVVTTINQSIKEVLDNRNVSQDLGMLLCDFWWDIDFQNTQNEGDVSFPTSKKPEIMMYRIFDMFSNENDFVLDCFGGSGSTFAVAHKMKRKWIGIEVGSHMDTHIISRLKNVISGSDKSGVTPTTNWQGGGSFKYYHLGDSIIKLNEDGTGDFNWLLGKEFIQESFLSSYDYIIDASIDFKEGELFTDKVNQPIVGVQTVGTKKRIAVVTLNEPKGKLQTLSYEEMQSIYKTIKKKYSPEYINIFTNRGIEIAYDSKPDDLEVIKIPNAIFAELEK